MTSIELMVTGTQAWATVTGTLTSGMVGIPVKIKYDKTWEGMTKNLVCRCSPGESNAGEKRAILNVGDTATVAHEVMKANMILYLGVEGFSSDGKLVKPTTWAKCGKIEYGANTCEDLSTDPELSVWNQIQTEMEQIRQNVVTPELVAEIQGYAQTATQAAQEARQAAEEAKQTVGSGLYYIPVMSQPTDTTLKFEFKPSVSGFPIPKPVTVELPVGANSGENENGLPSGLTNAMTAFFTNIQTYVPSVAVTTTSHNGAAVIASAQAVLAALSGESDSGGTGTGGVTDNGRILTITGGVSATEPDTATLRIN